MTEVLSSVMPLGVDEWGMPVDAYPLPSTPPPQTKAKKRKKRAPRSSDGKPRSRPIGIRLHPRERSALVAAARRARRDDVSAWCREVLLAHAAKEEIPHVGDDALEELLRLRRDLNSGIGNNLNQALTYANREARVGRAPDRRALLEAVEATMAGLEKLRTDLDRVLHPRGRR